MNFQRLKRLISGLFRKRLQTTISAQELMTTIGYNFSDPDLLQHALTHRSALQEEGADYSESNEILEFLGDAVLGLIVVEHLFRSFPNRREGELSKLKSMLVSGRALQEVATELKLGEFILMSQNEARSGGRKRGSILEDTLEAVIAAIYLDGGFAVARKFISEWILSDVDELINGDYDINFKSQLLEYAQGHGMSPEYRVIAEKGPDHAKRFEVEVSLDGETFGTGYGRSKKAAQQQAARIAVEHLAESEFNA